VKKRIDYRRALKIHRDSVGEQMQWKRCKSFARVVQCLCRSGTA